MRTTFSILLAAAATVSIWNAAHADSAASTTGAVVSAGSTAAPSATPNKNFGPGMAAPDNSTNSVPGVRNLVVFPDDTVIGYEFPRTVDTPSTRPTDRSDGNNMGAAVTNSPGITRAGTGTGGSPVVGQPNNAGTGETGPGANDKDSPSAVSNSGGITRAGGTVMSDGTVIRRGNWDGGSGYSPGSGLNSATVSSSGGISTSGSGYGQVYSGPPSAPVVDGAANSGYYSDPNAGNVTSNSSGYTRSAPPLAGRGTSPLTGNGANGLTGGGNLNRGR